jgi:polysaccharide biosynthesis/export protein
MLYTRSTGLLRWTQSTAGLMLLTLMAIAPIAPAAAQLPSLNNTNRSALPPNPAQADQGYTLGPGDRIRIDTFQLPQYSGEFEVLIDGSINLPVAGLVSVQGLTVSQAADVVSAAYSAFLRRPLVTLTLLVPRPFQVGIAGEVNRPGSYVVPRQDTQFPTVTQALETAGGPTLAADIGRVEIRRPQRSGTEQIISVDLRQLLATGDLRYDLALRDGDTIYVPTAEQIDLQETSRLASASFAPDESPAVNIAVVGEVFRPGTYTVTGTARTSEAGVPGGLNVTGRPPTVTRAIQVAGGIKSMADIGRIEVRRPTSSGAEQVFEIDLRALLVEGDLRQDAVLQEGDTIVVPTATALNPEDASLYGSASFSPDSIRVTVVGEVTQAGVVEIPPNTAMNQAILSAGGFNTRARRGTVRLVRLNPDGTVTEQRIPVDFAQGISEENPILQNNDVVIVGRSSLASISDTLGAILTPLDRFFSILGTPFRIFD